MQTFLTPPAFGEPMAPAHPSDEAVRLLALRRSTSIKLLGPPGPDPATLDAMLTIAARAPDHRKLFPFRFILFEGEGRARAGDHLAVAFRAAKPSADETELAAERGRFLRAPVVVALVSRLTTGHQTPEWEQTLTAGAVGMNLLLAASAHGFAACWVTEWCAYDEGVRRAFGLAETERIAGFHYLGTAKEPPKERQRPLLADLITRF
jgi:nitroreductase